MAPYNGKKRPPRIDDEWREAIIRMIEHGIPTADIIAITGISRGSINNISAADRAAKSGDIEKLIHIYLHISKPLARWAARRRGIDLDAALKEAGLEGV